jgi:hypothetical protein
MNGLVATTMRRLTRRLPDLLVAASLSAAAAGCKVTTIVDPYFRPESARVEQAYVSPGADFRNYTKLMTRPLEVYYPDNVTPPSPEELDRLRRIFRETFLAELGNDYEIVDAAAPDVMLVIGQIVDLKVLGAGGTYEPSGRLREVVASGQLTLLLEFQDSVTGRVLARVGESDHGSATAATDEAASWAQVEAAAIRWALLFKDFLDRNLGPQAASASIG